MTGDSDFKILFHARNRQEMELGKQLLEGAGIPVVIGASDQFEMLDVLEGQSAEGQLTIAVPIDQVDRASEVIEDAWGPEALADR